MPALSSGELPTRSIQTLTFCQCRRFQPLSRHTCLPAAVAGSVRSRAESYQFRFPIPDMTDFRLGTLAPAYHVIAAAVVSFMMSCALQETATRGSDKPAARLSRSAPSLRSPGTQRTFTVNGSQHTV